MLKHNINIHRPNRFVQRAGQSLRGCTAVCVSVCAATRGVLSFACRRCDMLASGRRRALAHARTEVRTAQVQEAGRVALCLALRGHVTSGLAV